jgi:hypothetical protein
MSLAEFAFRTVSLAASGRCASFTRLYIAYSEKSSIRYVRYVRYVRSFFRFLHFAQQNERFFDRKSATFFRFEPLFAALRVDFVDERGLKASRASCRSFASISLSEDVCFSQPPR